jgi:cytochrome bd-type quinol oxidase subunit 2
MSDITLRFDGLILFAVMALGAIAYLLIACITAVLAAIDERLQHRLARAAKRSALLCVVTGFLAVLLFRYIDERGMAITGPNWLDPWALPYLAVFAAGCWWLARRPAPPPSA